MTEGTSQLQAMLSLLDDPDPIVQQSVRTRLIEMERESAPALRRASSQSGDPIVRLNATSMLREMGVRKFRRELGHLMESSAERDPELERGAFLPALLTYPELDLAGYIQQIDTMASTLGNRLHEGMSGLQIVREMNRYLLEDLGFHGAAQERYYEPENSYMNCVLDRRVGIPITLAVLYVLLAQRLRIPLFGVGFPTHFLLKYHSPSSEFYVDPFNGGMVLTMGDCLRMLGSMGMEVRPEFLQPISHRLIVVRMLRNLAEIFKRDEPQLSTELERAIDALAS